jgi:hypothetical protein
MNTWQKDGDAWRVRCDTEQQPGAVVTVTTRDGRTKQVTLGERLNRLGFIYAVADTRPEATTVGDLAGVLALFDKARTHLKRPAIVLAVPGLPGVGFMACGEPMPGTIRLSVAGDKARVPGSIA